MVAYKPLWHALAPSTTCCVPEPQRVQLQSCPPHILALQMILEKSRKRPGHRLYPTSLSVEPLPLTVVRHGQHTLLQSDGA